MNSDEVAMRGYRPKTIVSASWFILWCRLCFSHVTSLLRLRVEPADWRALPRPSRHLDFSHSQSVTSAIISLCMKTKWKGLAYTYTTVGKIVYLRIPCIR